METGGHTQVLRLLNTDTRQERDISIIFPQSAIVELAAIEVEADVQIAARQASAKKYLALGDSITQGMDARGPISAYPLQLARLLDLELLNLGVGGHIFDLDALHDELPFEPDLVTIAYGTNDWSRDTTRSQIVDTVERYLLRVQDMLAGKADIYLVTPIWRANGGERRQGGTLSKFSVAIAEAAAPMDNVAVVDGLSLVSHDVGLFADGIHPTDEGFLQFGRNLDSAILAHEAAGNQG
jgi:lysophospholipase L1-like esterase